jgi:hypothetical protein
MRRHGYQRRKHRRRTLRQEYDKGTCMNRPSRCVGRSGKARGNSRARVWVGVAW